MYVSYYRILWYKVEILLELGGEVHPYMGMDVGCVRVSAVCGRIEISLRMR